MDLEEGGGYPDHSLLREQAAISRNTGQVKLLHFLLLHIFCPSYYSFNVGKYAYGNVCVLLGRSSNLAVVITWGLLLRPLMSSNENITPQWLTMYPWYRLSDIKSHSFIHCFVKNYLSQWIRKLSSTWTASQQFLEKFRFINPLQLLNSRDMYPLGTSWPYQQYSRSG